MSFSKSIARRFPYLGIGSCWAKRKRLLALLAGYTTVAVSVYLTADLGEWSPAITPLGRTLPLAAGFFVLPSLLEELFWRWLLIPPSLVGKLSAKSLLAILGTSVLFTAAHPLAGVFFVPHARDVFTNPWFLMVVFALGITCGTAYVVARSVWPPVIIHWLTVLAWKFLLGGPFVLLGR